MIKELKEYRLKNGFKLIIKEDHRAPIAIFQLVYKVGSSYESSGITGISHVLEHMMFRGTKQITGDKFLKTISNYGGKANAQTGNDVTAYYEIVPIKGLESCFKLEADRMKNLLLCASDFKKEMEIVKEERRLRTDDNPQALTMERFEAAAYVSSPYHHPVIGWMNDLEYLTIEDVKEWYHTWYVPNNAIGVLVGNVQPEQIYKLINKHFGSIKQSPLFPMKPQEEIIPLGMRTVTVKAPARLPWLVMGYNVPVLKTASLPWEPYALLLLCELLAGGDSARFQQRLVRGKRVLLDTSYQFSPFSRLNTTLTLMGTPYPEKGINAAREAINEEIQLIKTQAPEKLEIKRIKTQFIADKIYQEDYIAQQAIEIAMLEAVGLSWREIDNAYQAISAITPKQIQQVARRYLLDDHLTIAMLEPQLIDTIQNKSYTAAHYLQEMIK